MCKGTCNCKNKLKRNLSVIDDGKKVKAHFEGKEYLIVPVVMARADVPMNNALIPETEFHPQSWNGVPVTIGHPEGEGVQNGSANSPSALEKWSVGRIFEAEFDGTRLKGQAWVDVKKAEQLHPGIIDALVAGEMMDVSTGYFSDDFTQKGILNGKEYEVIHKALKPDHLALLPEEVGACSFEEGCGVRSNKRSLSMTVKEALKVLTNALTGKVDPKSKKAKRNARGNEADRRTIIADLISNDDTPFTPDDEEALRFMSDATFADVSGKYLAKNEGEEEELPDDKEEEVIEESEDEEDKTESNEETDEEDKTESNEDEEEEKPAAAKAKGNKKGKDKMRKNCAGKDNTFTNEDRAALAYARKQFSAHRNELIEEVVANTDLTKKEAEALDTTTLELLHRNSRPKEVDYSGRSAPKINHEKLSDEAKAMIAPSLVETIRNKKKEKA